MSTARRDVAIEVEKMRQERVVQKQDQRELSSLKKRVNVEEKEKKAEEYPTGQATVTNRDQNEGGDHFIPLARVGAPIFISIDHTLRQGLLPSLRSQLTYVET